MSGPQVEVNGEPRQLPPGCTVAKLVELLGLGGKRVAVELNQDILPRSAHAERVLADGDRPEVIHAIGGG